MMLNSLFIFSQSPAYQELLVQWTMSTPEEPPPVPPASFLSKEEAIKWAIDTSTSKHRPLKTKKSDPQRIQFVCTEPGCKFKFTARKRNDGLFHLSKWKWHKCDKFSNPKVKTAWVKDKAMEALVRRESIKPKELQEKLKDEMGVDISRKKRRRPCTTPARKRRMRTLPLRSSRASSARSRQ